MNIRKLFRGKRDGDAEPTWEERLHKARMESLRKKTQAADEIIGMLKDPHIERRIMLMPFIGPERRHG